jgi:hypothetical protein
MALLIKRTDVQRAADDLRARTLSKIPRPLDRLIYLASLRDYNTGIYYHDGLACRFPEDVVSEAISECHREVFREMFALPLETLVQQLEAYVDSTHTALIDFVAAWQGIEPYRVAVPADTDALSAQFFFSNLRIALAILQSRLRGPTLRQAAWRLPSLAQ